MSSEKGRASRTYSPSADRAEDIVCICSPHTPIYSCLPSSKGSVVSGATTASASLDGLCQRIHDLEHASSSRYMRLRRWGVSSFVPGSAMRNTAFTTYADNIITNGLTGCYACCSASRRVRPRCMYPSVRRDSRTVALGPVPIVRRIERRCRTSAFVS
ncbi:hypothetical protein VTO73DRAFT_12982 [Trametes versicolor]